MGWYLLLSISSLISLYSFVTLCFFVEVKHADCSMVWPGEKLDDSSVIDFFSVFHSAHDEKHIGREQTHELIKCHRNVAFVIDGHVEVGEHEDACERHGLLQILFLF